MDLIITHASKMPTAKATHLCHVLLPRFIFLAVNSDFMLEVHDPKVQECNLEQRKNNPNKVKLYRAILTLSGEVFGVNSVTIIMG